VHVFAKPVAWRKIVATSATKISLEKSCKPISVIVALAKVSNAQNARSKSLTNNQLASIFVEAVYLFNQPACAVIDNCDYLFKRSYPSVVRVNIVGFSSGGGAFVLLDVVEGSILEVFCLLYCISGIVPRLFNMISGIVRLVWIFLIFFTNLADLFVNLACIDVYPSIFLIHSGSRCISIVLSTRTSLLPRDIIYFIICVICSSSLVGTVILRLVFDISISVCSSL